MARSYRSGPDDPVFPTGTGGHRDKDNLRNRILASAITRADQLLAQREQMPLPTGLTPHKRRHTFASILVALGHDPASVMAALGHTDPKFTLRVYTRLMRRDTAERARLKALVDGEIVETHNTEPADQAKAACQPKSKSTSITQAQSVENASEMQRGSAQLLPLVVPCKRLWGAIGPGSRCPASMF
jgi:hypothetical protein